MDIQLQELIDKIKSDGVASAENEAKRIISEAEEKAQHILSDAQKKADALMQTAKAENSRMEKASIDAIRQAGRNVLISFRDSIIAQLNAIIKKDTASALSAEVLKTLIPELLKKWLASEDASSISVLLSAKDLESVQSSLAASLKAEIAKGLIIKTDETLADGFRIGIKNGEAYYDFSSESVASLF
ncbi:MAG TPA: V-type ATP synthase subunit E, partial [Treponemataceae bacterium]|nr:V-type ATP synthase subunit E [Treponemataceae bacterium]